MGSDIVGPGTGFQLTNDDWFDLDLFVHEHKEGLNRTSLEADELSIRLRNDEYTEVWVVRDSQSGALAGFVALHLNRGSAYKHSASLRIYVAPDYQGKGHGDRLISRAVNHARANSIKRIVATPYLDGTDKIGFFLRYGFEIEGTARNAVRLNGSLIDVAQLARVA